MQLSSIDFTTLTRVEYRSKQVERIVASGAPPPRLIFADSGFFYKIWPTGNFDNRTVYWKGARCLVENRNSRGEEVLLGFLYGLYDESVCPAFVDHIYDGTRLAGYVTRRGRPLSNDGEGRPEFTNFVKRFFRRSLRAGVVHRDLKLRNIVELDDGRLSLIDLECPLTLLNGFRVKRERRNGSLAPFTSRKYRKLIRKYLDPITANPTILAARARNEKGPPKLFLLSK